MQTRKIHNGSRLTLIAFAAGYCMVRFAGCAPFVMSLKEWNALPDE